ncbi:MAG: ribbon-helix-helix domain-containing protein [Candidatus Margulisbacteria bacterium]|jgi:predicted DNA-binding protein|nr:ribbon-helix-helix domain-containing protein [Candidatus Margulisiibacteriota bacterium]
MTTVRLTDEIEHKLEVFSRANHKSKSDLIREALANFFAREETDSYTLGAAYFGKYGSGNGNLSGNYKKLLKRKLYAKYGAR